MPIRAINSLLLLAVACAGIAHIALLPPFEGYDEAAHFSSIQQIADTGRIPIYGQDRMSADIDAYAGPTPASAGQPYRDFLQSGRQVSPAAGPTRFAPGAQLNYQAQHPPLYYLAMTLPYRALAGLPWRWHMFGLRLASWALAFAGFAWGALLAQRLVQQRGESDERLLLPMVWPFLFPEFFPEFARLTNDSLCILLVACAWWLVIGWMERGPSWKRSLALGVTLGAGLLTKAFFLAITAGFAGLLAVATTLGPRPRRWEIAAAAPVVAILLGGAWYLAKLRTTGTVTGAQDFIAIDAKGGVFGGILGQIGISQVVHGIRGIIAGFYWGGTWSFVQPSRWFTMPALALLLLPPCLYVLRLRRWDLPALSPIFFLVPMLAGLLYHVLAMIVATGSGNGTPGWYLHILDGPLALVVALGWAGRTAMVPLMLYAVAVSSVLACMQSAFFSGCLGRVGGGQVSLAETARCMTQLGPLREIALPGVGLVFVLLAVAALLLGLRVAVIDRPAHSGSG